MYNLRSLSIFILLLVYFGCDNKTDDEPEIPEDKVDFANCLTGISNDVFELMTWNIESFPKLGEETLQMVVNVIESQKPDVIALQEITTKSSFDELTSALPGYSGQIYISGDINLGFLFKESEITVADNIQEILTEDSYVFPRAPVINQQHSLAEKACKSRQKICTIYILL